MGWQPLKKYFDVDRKSIPKNIIWPKNLSQSVEGILQEFQVFLIPIHFQIHI